MKMTAVIAALALLVVPVGAQKRPPRSTSDGKSSLASVQPHAGPQRLPSTTSEE
jgi:hypothetical protein